jgi:hypothetical protein
MPGADRLSDSERSLCEHLVLSPLQYSQIKTAVINISLVRGAVKRGEVEKKLAHVEVAKVGGVFDFVITAGWARE